MTRHDLPEPERLARMLRSGQSRRDLSIRYAIDERQIANRLRGAGWDAVTGRWVGGGDRTTVIPLTVRGGGPGRSGHYVAGGDNPNVVPTSPIPHRHRARPTGFNWPEPVAVAPPVAVPEPPPEPIRIERAYSTSANDIRRKLSDQALQEIADAYADGESTITLATNHGVNERTIRKALRKMGVRMRTRSEALKLRHQQNRLRVQEAS